MKRKKLPVLLIGLILMLVLINSVFAAWIFYYQKSITANVVGNGNPFTITQEFEDMSIDCSNPLAEGLDGKYTIETIMTIQLPDIFTYPSLLVNIDEDITDLTSGQCDYENDCEVALVYDTYPTAYCYKDGEEILCSDYGEPIPFDSDICHYYIGGEKISCSEYQGEGEEMKLFDGDILDLSTYSTPLGLAKNLILRMSCVKNSCETKRDITITLTEV